jgi:signal transduction histidine kinase
MKDAARIYASEAKRKGLEYDIDVHAAPDCFLLGDQKKIRTVVANLIANAGEPISPSVGKITVAAELTTLCHNSQIHAERLSLSFV